MQSLEKTRRYRSSSIRAVSEPDIIPDDESADDFIDSEAPPVVWKASAKSTVRVKEISRSVEDYMALPASEYSVLSAKQIERISDTEFKCNLPGINFFGTKIQPILYAEVYVYPEEARAEISVTRAETTGSETAEKLSGTFSISSTNKVFAATDEKGDKTLNSDTFVEIKAYIPKSSILPVRVVESSGNFIIQNSLNIVVAGFIRILVSDFKRWSAGSDERDAVDGASLEM